MESLILSFNAVAPLFLLMLTGYVIKRLNIVQKKDFDMINKLVFKIFLPVLLFQNLYATKTVDTLDINIVLFIVTGVLTAFILGRFFVCAISKSTQKERQCCKAFSAPIMQFWVFLLSIIFAKATQAALHH